MARPEFRLKWALVEYANHKREFPNMRGMWGLTAAQQAFLMATTKKDGKKAKPIKQKRYSMDELRKVDQDRQEKQGKARSAV